MSKFENLRCGNKYVSNKALMNASKVITLRTILVRFALSRPWDQDAWEQGQFDENGNIKFGVNTMLPSRKLNIPAITTGPKIIGFNALNFGPSFEFLL